MSRTCVRAAVFLACAAFCSSCTGAAKPRYPKSSPASAVASGPAVAEAHWIGNGAGWARSDSAAYVTTDGGSHWRTVKIPSALVAGHPFAARTSSEFLEVAPAGTALALYHSTDGGSNWRRDHSVDLAPAMVSSVDLRVEGDLVGILLNIESGSNGGTATFVSTSDGKDWHQSDAPVSGDISVSPAGTVLLVDGATKQKVYRSTDQGASWNGVTMPSGDIPSGGTIAFGEPRWFSASEVIVSGTSRASDDSTASERFYLSDDGGGSFREVGSTSIQGHFGAGVIAPSVAERPDVWIAAEPDGSKIYRFVRSSSAQVVSPDGLPQGVQSLDFTSDEIGWAQVVTGSCAAGKNSCSTTSALYSTTDGGQTWNVVPV